MARKSEVDAKTGLGNLLAVNWILKFLNNKQIIKVFTTRPDTIFGASFIALSVDHPLNKDFLSNNDFKKFKSECDKTGTTEEALANAQKIGFNTKLFAQHPFIKNKKIPIFFC